MPVTRPLAEQIDAAWAAEAEARLTAYKAGEIQALPMRQTIARHAQATSAV